MTTSALAPPAAALPLRRRGDLVFAKREAEGERRWTVKDPVALRFFELGTYEQFLLSQLDGAVSLEEIEARFLRRFGQSVPRQQLLEFVGRLWQQGLLVHTHPGAGAALLARRRVRESPSWLSRLSGLLAFRWRGVNPDRFLTSLHGWLGWIYSPLPLAFMALVIVAAGLLITAEFDTLLRRLPDLQSFLNVHDLVTGAVLLGGIKILHELGHGLTCKHFGGECHELGAMWLVVTPALYCNVSDAWLLPSRWQRAAISGAGIVVELFLAAVFTFLWWFSEPGAFHDACLWGMVIGSVNTLLINGNPLMRFDGYYVLGDVLNISNLRSRSQGEAGATLAAGIFGIRRMQRPAGGSRRAWLFAYGVASWVYQWVVLIGIVWFLYHLARPYGLDPVVVGLGGLLIGTRLVAGAMKSVLVVRGWWREGRMRWLRFMAGLAVVGLGLWGLATWPFPHTVSGPAFLQLADSRTLYVVTPGFLDRAAAPGPMRAGEALFALSNPDLELELVKLQGTVEKQEKVVSSLSQRVVSEPHLSAQLAAAQTALIDHRERLAGRRKEIARLEISAPEDGEWRAAGVDASSSSRLLEDSFGKSTLSQLRWSDRRLWGTWSAAGTAVAEVAPTGEIEARVYVEQSEIPFVELGQTVRLRLPLVSDRIVEGTVVEVASRNEESPPMELFERKALAGQPGTGGFRSRDVVYEVRVQMSGDAELLAREVGEAKIEVGCSTLLKRFVRFVQLTFRIREA